MSRTTNLLQLLQRKMSSVQQGLHLSVWDGKSELRAGPFHRLTITPLFSAPLQSLSSRAFLGFWEINWLFLPRIYSQLSFTALKYQLSPPYKVHCHRCVCFSSPENVLVSPICCCLFSYLHHHYRGVSAATDSKHMFSPPNSNLRSPQPNLTPTETAPKDESFFIIF